MPFIFSSFALPASFSEVFRSLKPKRRPISLTRRSFRIIRKASSKSGSRRLTPTTFAILSMAPSLDYGVSAQPPTIDSDDEARTSLLVSQSLRDVNSSFKELANSRPPPGEKILERFWPPDNEDEDNAAVLERMKQIARLGFMPLSPPPSHNPKPTATKRQTDSVIAQDSWECSAHQNLQCEICLTKNNSSVAMHFPF